MIGPRNLLLRTAAAGSLAFGAAGTASAADAPIAPSEDLAAPAKVDLIDNSRLGCGQGVPLWSIAGGGGQCAFDAATRGARVSARQDFGRGSIEAYATVAHATAGAFTPDQLLLSPEHRGSEATDFFMVGFKGSALDNRLKLTSEFASTNRIVDELVGRDWHLADRTRAAGTSAFIRLDATLADRPGLRWSLTGEYRTVSDDFRVGRSAELSRYFAMPGTRLALSSKARIGAFGVSAGIDQRRSEFGTSESRKAGIDWDGIAVRLVSRDSTVSPVEGGTLVESRTRTNSFYLDLDVGMLAASLLPTLDEVPSVVPTNVSLTFRSGETESRHESASERYSRSSLGIDGTWETPIGETSLSYWRDDRTGLTGAAGSRSTEMMQVDHSVRRGNWRFGLDASLTRNRGDGAAGYDDRSLSFGQSVAYSAPGGPEFRLQLGQDRAAMRMSDDSYASTDQHSQITASLDLSRYLQTRFERPDLRLTLDYRKALERSDSEMNLYDELVERWTDGYRREGVLVSFGMRL